MTTVRPFLFLDVDETILPGGVVYNAELLDREGRQPQGTDGQVALDVEISSYHDGVQAGRIYLDPQLLDGVRKLADAFDIVWTSAWKGRARKLDSALSIKTHYCLAPQAGDLTNYKGRAIISFLDGYHTWHFGDSDDPVAAREAAEALPVEPRVRAFAWADDDQDWDEDQVLAWADRNEVAALIVRPQKGVGLTPQCIDDLLAFSARHASATA
jgi:hypothetical protein